jgi:hypothetical protein
MLAAAHLLVSSLRRGPAAALLLALAAWLTPAAARAAATADQLASYAYEDTRQLVSMVEDAADLVARQGPAAFPQFAVPDTRWFHDDVYIFVYAEDGTCVFHPVSPELVGKNLIDLHDIHGKPMIRWITDVARLPGPTASGWVFYLWEDRTQLAPQWKSAYVRKAIAPDGRVYLVGAGSTRIRVEMPFITAIVDRACDLLQSEGKEAAFSAFRNDASPFDFLDTFVFVIDPEGHLLVDPAYPTLAGRDVAGFTDAMRVPVIRELLAKLEHADHAAVLYLWPKPGSPVPARKVIYARKVTVGGETMIVGSDFFLATPIWMKVDAAPSWPSAPPA